MERKGSLWGVFDPSIGIHLTISNVRVSIGMSIAVVLVQ